MNFAPFLAKNLHFSIGEEFCTFLAKNLHLSFSPLARPWVHTFRCQKRCALRNSSRSSFCFRQMAWQGIEGTETNNTAAPSFFSSKKLIKLTPKTIGNRKRDCAWGCARGINTTWENLQIEKHKSGVLSAHWTDLCFSICRFSQVVFILRAQPHAQSLFLFPIVFGINVTMGSMMECTYFCTRRIFGWELIS